MACQPIGAEAESIDFGEYLQGRSIFKSQCAPCHGNTGRGNGPWGKDMPVQPRNFRVGIFKYRSTPMGFQPTDEDLRRTIKRGVSGTAMPTFAKTLSDRNLNAILVLIKSFSPRWRDPERNTNAIPLAAVPIWFRKGASLEKHKNEGRILFDQICVNCHGITGKGDGPLSTGLTNVWGHAAPPADLRLAHHRSGPDRADLFRTISLGLDGTPMVGFRGALRDEQIWNLISFIESFSNQ